MLDFLILYVYLNLAIIFYELPIYLQECIQFCLLHRFLGKLISQYISVYVQQGSRSKEIIFDGFDYERWKKTYLKSHSKQVELIILAAIHIFIYLHIRIYIYIYYMYMCLYIIICVCV